MAQEDTFYWVAFHQSRKFWKFREDSTLKGFGIRFRCYEGPEVEEATIFHVINLGITTKCYIIIIIVSNDTCLTT
jgi:hypothetical protein